MKFKFHELPNDLLKVFNNIIISKYIFGFYLYFGQIAHALFLLHSSTMSFCTSRRATYKQIHQSWQPRWLSGHTSRLSSGRPGFGSRSWLPHIIHFSLYTYIHRICNRPTKFTNGQTLLQHVVFLNVIQIKYFFTEFCLFKCNLDIYISFSLFK